MAGRTSVWEKRFKALHKEIDNHLQSSQALIAEQAVSEPEALLDSPKYWERRGKYEVLLRLSNRSIALEKEK